jgi:hypothetical protein
MAKHFFYLSYYVLLLLFVWQLGRAESLTTTSDLSPTLSSAASNPATATASLSALLTNSSSTKAPLHIPLQTAPPDPIGFAQVSGFYGPGTWAGWFLTLCASWVRLVRNKPGFDLNTWLYLLGMNWAAIDLVMHMHELSKLRSANADDWMKGCALIGAALTVVFWGSLHAACQTGISFALWGQGELQGWLTLVAGLLLPAISLTVALFALGLEGNTHEIADLVPALYYDSMIANGKGGHHVSIAVALTSGAWCLLLCIILLLLFVWSVVLPESTKANVEAALNPIWSVWKERFQTGYFCSGFIIIYLTLITIAVTKQVRLFWLFLPYSPVLLVFCLFVWPFAGGFFILVISISYAFKAYVSRATSPSQSCFFMPCAPQSITETDQAFALLAGLFSFVVPEFGIPVIQRVRAQYRERRLFRQDVERRIELARMTRTVAEENRADTSEEVD